MIAIETWRRLSRTREKGISSQPLGYPSPVNGGAQSWKKDSLGSLGAFPPMGKAALSLQPRPESSYLFPLGRPWFCKRFKVREHEESHKFPPSRLLKKLTLTPITAVSVAVCPGMGKAEGNFPARGQCKGVRTADQSAFPSWGSQISHLDSCNHLPIARSALVLTSLQSILHISTRMIFLKCNSDHVTFLLKILQQVRKMVRIEILIALH